MLVDCGRVTALDGRHARRARSRDAIVAALLDSLRSGDGLPASAEIAHRAGVTQRTLFNLFVDVGSLLAEAVERQVAHVREILPRPTPGTASERVGAWVQSLSEVADEIAEVRWAVLTHQGDSPELAAGLRRVRSLTRRRLSMLLRPELDGLDTAARRELLAAAESAVDPLTWRLLRRQQGLSRMQAASVVRRTLLALARDAVA